MLETGPFERVAEDIGQLLVEGEADDRRHQQRRDHSHQHRPQIFEMLEEGLFLVVAYLVGIPIGIPRSALADLLLREVAGDLLTRLENLAEESVEHNLGEPGN